MNESPKNIRIIAGGTAAKPFPAGSLNLIRSIARLTSRPKGGLNEKINDIARARISGNASTGLNDAIHPLVSDTKEMHPKTLRIRRCHT